MIRNKSSIYFKKLFFALITVLGLSCTDSDKKDKNSESTSKVETREALGIDTLFIFEEGEFRGHNLGDLKKEVVAREKAHLEEASFTFLTYTIPFNDYEFSDLTYEFSKEEKLKRIKMDFYVNDSLKMISIYNELFKVITESSTKEFYRSKDSTSVLNQFENKLIIRKLPYKGAQGVSLTLSKSVDA